MPTGGDEETGVHSRIHYHLGSAISLAEIVFYATIAFVLSLSLTAFLFFVVVEHFEVTEPKHQAGVYLLIAVCLVVTSRPIIWGMKGLRQVIERWEASAREMHGRGEPLPWLTHKLFGGLEWLQRVPRHPPRARDLFLVDSLHRPHAAPRSHTQSKEDDDAFDEVESLAVSDVAVSVQDDSYSINTAVESSRSSAKAEPPKKGKDKTQDKRTPRPPAIRHERY